MMQRLILVIISFGLASQALAQAAPSFPQLNTFNSTPGTTWDAHVQKAVQASSVDRETAESVRVAADYERSHFAGGSAVDDPFYADIPSNASTAAVGSLLKFERVTNSSDYTLASDTALSRIVFQSENFNGTKVPASAYVLLPWMPRKFEGKKGVPVIGWGHGTSGRAANCAPSKTRNLLYQYWAPFTMANQGYAVVAPDYAGLGVEYDADGNFVPHQWTANQAGANDVFHAVQAAQKAWPQLSKDFVVMGHSQGGGMAWAAANRQARKPVKGYLGTVAGSPATDFIKLAQASPPTSVGLFATLLSTTIGSIFPDFKPSDFFTPAGLVTNKLSSALQACQAVHSVLVTSPGLVKPDWNTSTYHVQAYNDLTTVNHKPIAGPMLVLQGTGDPVVPSQVTTEVVNETCASLPKSPLHYATFEGVSHVPVLQAAQHYWLGWIADRFKGLPADAPCSRSHHEPLVPVESYTKETSYFMEYPLYTYETA